MSAAEPYFAPDSCWSLEALPGEGLIATSSHHVLVVEVDDDIIAGGAADEIVATFDAHCRLLGRGAAGSLRAAVSAILAERHARAGAVALVSTWDDEIAVYLHGRAGARLLGAGNMIVLSGEDALVATDVVLTNTFHEVVIHVGDRPADDGTPMELGDVTAGRGLRLRVPAPAPSGGPRPLNIWSAAG